MGKKLEEWQEKFEDLDIPEQIKVLLEILKLSQRLNQGADLRQLGGKKETGVSSLNKKISELEECKLINQSVTGLYKNEVDLLNI